jgi:DNA-binding NtrC family response regulator
MSKKRLVTDVPQTIVVIDDEKITLDYFKHALVPFCETCNIKYFSEISDEFFIFIKNHRVDLFIMDVVLGSQNAVKLSEEIVYKRKGSIFLFISGYDYSIDSFSHLKGKCVYDFVSKPLKVDVIQTVVSTLLNISASYKITFLDTNIEPKEEQLDEMRKKYKKLIEQDQILIRQFKNGFSELALNLSTSPKTTYKL